MFDDASSCFKASDQADKKAFDPEYVASNYLLKDGLKRTQINTGKGNGGRYRSRSISSKTAHIDNQSLLLPAHQRWLTKESWQLNIGINGQDGMGQDTE